MKKKNKWKKKIRYNSNIGIGRRSHWFDEIHMKFEHSLLWFALKNAKWNACVHKQNMQIVVKVKYIKRINTKHIINIATICVDWFGIEIPVWLYRWIWQITHAKPAWVVHIENSPRCQLEIVAQFFNRPICLFVCFLFFFFFRFVQSTFLSNPFGCIHFALKHLTPFYFIRIKSVWGIFFLWASTIALNALLCYWKFQHVLHDWMNDNGAGVKCATNMHLMCHNWKWSQVLWLQGVNI